MAAKPHCPVCKTAVSARQGEMCEPCARAALGAHGWTAGTPDGRGGLRRGPVDPVAAAELTRRAEAGRQAPRAPETTPPRAPAEPSAPPPPCIRATRSFWTSDARGRPHHIGWRDIYRGQEAAELWTRHPEHFERFPIATTGAL